MLVDEPKDIGVLMRELNRDFEEHVDEIKNLLYTNFRKDILRVANRGFAEWYKAKLRGDVFVNPKDDIGFYVTHIYAGENYLSRGPHDLTGRPEIIEWIEYEGTANDIRDKLNAGETEFTIDNHSVKYFEDKLEISNEQEDQPEKD